MNSYNYKWPEPDINKFRFFLLFFLIRVESSVYILLQWVMLKDALKAIVNKL